MNQPGTSTPLIQAEEQIVPVDLPAQENVPPKEETDVVDTTLYVAWRRHLFTFIAWLLLSLAATILIPFSESLNAGEAILVSLGAWMGLIASGLYFLPIPLKEHPARISYLAFFIILFSICAFVVDFPIAITCVWSMRNDKGKLDTEDDDEVILGVSAGLLFLGGCFSIVAFAKCMMMGTYETPTQK